jgi:hypothetical protein
VWKNIFLVQQSEIPEKLINYAKWQLHGKEIPFLA